jgi:large-conductance mechanosensitive channel
MSQQKPNIPVPQTTQPVSQPTNTFSAFFNKPTGTVLTFAAGLCIGGAFKDLVQSVVNNIIQPLIIKVLIMTNIYNIGMFSSILSGKNSALNITSTISSLVSFIIITITVYILYTLINVN